MEWGARKASRVDGDPCRLEGLARPGCDEGRELGVCHANPWGQVSGDGGQQGVDDPVLAAVQSFQAVQTGVGRAQLRALHAVADSL